MQTTISRTDLDVVDSKVDPKPYEHFVNILSCFIFDLQKGNFSSALHSNENNLMFLFLQIFS